MSRRSANSIYQRSTLLESRDGRFERSAAAIFGAVSTAALHVLLVSPLLFDGGHRMHRITQDEGGQTSGVRAMTLVNLQDNVDDAAEPERPADPDISERVSPARALLPVGSLHLATGVVPVVIEDIDSARSVQDGPPSEDGERALLFGRYLGQVTARIERAWVRPRSPVGSSTFTCLLQVEQDRERNVTEITLKRCNGTTAWQLSLVHAIESASPFPAPPDPAVFSPTLVFEMSAEPYMQGGSEQGYEPLSAQGAVFASASESGDVFDQTVAKIRGGNSGPTNIIELRINGTPARDAVPPVAGAESGQPGPEGRGIAVP